jgi:hypothetical protein
LKTENQIEPLVTYSLNKIEILHKYHSSWKGVSNGIIGCLLSNKIEITHKYHLEKGESNRTIGYLHANKIEILHKYHSSWFENQMESLVTYFLINRKFFINIIKKRENQIKPLVTYSLIK